TVSSKPARTAAVRAMFAPCSPTGMTQPSTTSSTSVVSSLLRSRSACSAVTARRTGVTSCKEPSLRPLPRGVRTASKIYASAMVCLLIRMLERAPYQLFHDLVGAAVDLLHARVGVEARDRVFPHVAVAAVELQALVHDLALKVGGPVLGHGGGRDIELALQMTCDAVVDE